MKSSVQLGLLCLSLLISSLHGEEEAERDSSMQERPILFDDPDLEQFEMYRVRRQTVSTEENTAKTVAAVPSSGSSKIKRKQPRPGGLSPLGNPTVYIHHRTKRQEKSKNKKRKNRPGSQSLLASIGVPLKPAQQTVKVKREAGGQRPLPES